MHIARIGFITESTLYGHRYGTPTTMTSAWPSTSTSCCRCTAARVRWCTASVSPAVTPVMPYGAVNPWKILRLAFAGARFSARFVASIVAWSRIDHSHSRLLKKSYGAGNTSLLSVVSIVKIFRWLASMRPMRHADECSAEFSGSINDRECTIVWLLWWWRRLLYDASPTGTDLWPPSMATRLMLT